MQLWPLRHVLRYVTAATRQHHSPYHRSSDQLSFVWFRGYIQGQESSSIKNYMVGPTPRRVQFKKTLKQVNSTFTIKQHFTLQKMLRFLKERNTQRLVVVLLPTNYEVSKGFNTIKYLTSSQLADVFTKILPSQRVRQLFSKSGMTQGGHLTSS